MDTGGDMTDPLESEETRIYDASTRVALLKSAGAGAARVVGHAERESSRPTVPALRMPAPPQAHRPAAAGAPLRPVAQVTVQSPLFRHEAMRAYEQGQGVAAPLDVAPLPTRVLFATLLVLALAALGVAGFGKVELTSLGRGVLRAPEGMQPLSAPLAGVVAEVLVEPGQTVAPGQLLLRIDSTQVRAQLLDAERKLAALRERQAHEEAQAELLHERAVDKLQQRRRLLQRRIRSQQRGVKRLEQRAARFVSLEQEGLSDRGALEEASEAVDGAERAWLALKDEQALADVELSRVEREREAGRIARREERERAEADVATVRMLLAQAEIKAARHGTLEGLRVSPGQLVQAGALLARLVPGERPQKAVAFLPERDRAFLEEGAAVRLELDRLPVGEFGSLGARIERISQDVASADELETHLGSRFEGVYFRVDLSLPADPERAELAEYLRSGTLITVRAPLRSRRIIGLLFDPIRRWLD
jgi:membrane fusion protein